MIDENFIIKSVSKGEQAAEKVNNNFFQISTQQLNWKPSPGQWSIGECLDHLIISDRSYFNVLEKISDGTYQMTFWDRFSPLTPLWGKFLKDQLQETVKIKMTAPKKLIPSASNKTSDFIATYLKNLNAFMTLISACKKIDLDKTIIRSPTINIATYSLRDAIEFLISHEHRHINQAIKTKSHTSFPVKFYKQK